MDATVVKEFVAALDLPDRVVTDAATMTEVGRNYWGFGGTPSDRGQHRQSTPVGVSANSRERELTRRARVLRVANTLQTSTGAWPASDRFG
jgi:hypothetical protein